MTAMHSWHEHCNDRATPLLVCRLALMAPACRGICRNEVDAAASALSISSRPQLFQAVANGFCNGRATSLLVCRLVLMAPACTRLFRNESHAAASALAFPNGPNHFRLLQMALAMAEQPPCWYAGWCSWHPHAHDFAKVSLMLLPVH